MAKENQRILMVEDLDYVLEPQKRLLETILKQMSYIGVKIDTAANGRLALEHIAKQKENGSSYNLILCDYEMPELDSVGFYKSLEPEKQKKVVFCTGQPEKLRRQLENTLQDRDYQEPLIISKSDFTEEIEGIIKYYLPRG